MAGAATGPDTDAAAAVVVAPPVVDGRPFTTGADAATVLSAFDEGHKRPYFGPSSLPFGVHKSCSTPFVVACPSLPFGFASVLTDVTTDEFEPADEADEVDVTDDAELLRCGPLRGCTIRDTSSALIEFMEPLPDEVHPRRGRDCRLGGDATAVMGNKS